MITKLPKPDQYGNYWLGKKILNEKEAAGPAIFPSKGLTSDGQVFTTGKFILFLGSERGFVFNGPELKRFSTAESALHELNRSATEAT